MFFRKTHQRMLEDEVLDASAEYYKCLRQAAHWNGRLEGAAQRLARLTAATQPPPPPPAPQPAPEPVQ